MGTVETLESRCVVIVISISICSVKRKGCMNKENSTRLAAGLVFTSE